MTYEIGFAPFGTNRPIRTTGQTIRECFEKLIKAVPVMGVTKCGNPSCGSENIRPADKGGKFGGCMWRCDECGGNLTLHVHKEEPNDVYVDQNEEWWWPGKDGGSSKPQEPPI